MIFLYSHDMRYVRVGGGRQFDGFVASKDGLTAVSGESTFRRRPGPHRMGGAVSARCTSVSSRVFRTDADSPTGIDGRSFRKGT